VPQLRVCDLSPSSQERLAALVVYDDATFCEQDPAVLVTHDANDGETVLESWHDVGKKVGGHPFERDLALCC
jgi:hypothetical protein